MASKLIWKRIFLVYRAKLLKRQESPDSICYLRYFKEGINHKIAVELVAITKADKKTSEFGYGSKTTKFAHVQKINQ